MAFGNIPPYGLFCQWGIKAPKPDIFLLGWILPGQLGFFLVLCSDFYIVPGLSGFNFHLQMDSQHGLSLGSQRLRPSVWARCSLLGSRP